MRHIFNIFVCMAVALAANGTEKPVPGKDSVLDRETRLMVVEGNKLYGDKRYADAEAQFRKALERVPDNDLIRYNLAATFIREAGGKTDDKLAQEAMQILTDLSRNSNLDKIAELASYNAGNMMFNNENYQGAIDFYKQSLRKNPDNDKARQNLRLAQLKLEQQQQNQDQNQQNQDQNQDQQQEQQDKQDQQQNQNQDQQSQDQQNQDQQQNQQQNPQNRRDNISDENAEAILKTMQNEENKTRQRVEARKKKDQSRRRVTNPW